MKPITEAAKAKVSSPRSEDRGVEVYSAPPGMHMWMGHGTRYLLSTIVPTRLGCRLRSPVLLQIPEHRRTWGDQRIINS